MSAAPRKPETPEQREKRLDYMREYQRAAARKKKHAAALKRAEEEHGQQTCPTCKGSGVIIQMLHPFRTFEEAMACPLPEPSAIKHRCGCDYGRGRRAPNLFDYSKWKSP